MSADEDRPVLNADEVATLLAIELSSVGTEPDVPHDTFWTMNLHACGFLAEGHVTDAGRAYLRELAANNES